MTHGIHKLPPEVLAACFALLEFDDLISISHVSRFWRSSSLSFPRLWIHITLTGPYVQPANLLHMAMSRAGQLAVDFHYFQSRGHAPESMPGAVAQYMHRFQTFAWKADPSNLDISRPAPLLREFTVCEDRMFIVPRDFLGGVAGNLRTLHLGATSFPDACPTLETVTHLTVWYPEFADESRRFDRLFDLFHRLEVLHLHDIDGSPGVELPGGPAPCTLREVKLVSWWTNLLDLSTVWGLGSVADVRLNMPPAIPSKIAAFITGAEDLSVLLEGVDEFQIVAGLSNMYRRELICIDSDTEGLWDPISVLANVLEDRAALSHVQALELPLSVLTRAVAGAYHWPRLARLAVHIRRRDIREAHPYLVEERCQPFPWSALECLRWVPTVEALALHVHKHTGSMPPTSTDERELIECLSEMCGSLPREVLIYGFPVERTLALQDDGRHHLVFIPTN